MRKSTHHQKPKDGRQIEKHETAPPPTPPSAPKPDLPRTIELSDPNAKQTQRLKWVKLGLEILTVLIIGAYTFVTAGQWRAFVASNKMAKAASDLTNRPYVGLDAIAITYGQRDKNGRFIMAPKLETAERMDFHPRIKNFGPVPARNYMATWKMFVNGVPQPASEIFGSPVFAKTSTLFPTQLTIFSEPLA